MRDNHSPSARQRNVDDLKLEGGVVPLHLPPPPTYLPIGLFEEDGEERSMLQDFPLLDCPKSPKSYRRMGPYR
eukprot:1295468-Karenia_brevis.AAC.1